MRPATKTSRPTDGGCTTDPRAARPQPDVVDLLRDILTRLERLEARFERRPLLDPQAARSLILIADGAKDTAFTSVEVLQFAQTTAGAELHASLSTLRLLAPRPLGRWLHRMVGARVGNRRLARIGEDRFGAIWTFARD